MKRFFSVLIAIAISCSLCVVPTQAAGFAGIVGVVKGIVDGLGIGSSILQFCEDLGLYWDGDNAEDFGMPGDVVNLFDTESLAKIIKNIFIDNRCDIMSVLDTATIMTNASIIDKEVVEVVGTEAIVE